MKAFIDRMYKSKAARTAGARVIGELGNQTVAWGGFMLTKTLAPEMIDDLKQVVAKKIIRPRLNTSKAIFDSTIPNFIADSKREKAGDDLDKQAEIYASRLVDLGLLFAFGWGGQIIGQAAGNAAMGIPEWNPKTGNWFMRQVKELGDGKLNTMNAVDKASQAGLVLTLNQGLGGTAKSWQNWISGALQRNFDIDPIVADDRASLLVNTMLPSVFGAAMSGAYQHHITKDLDWPHLATR